MDPLQTDRGYVLVTGSGELMFSGRDFMLTMAAYPRWD